MRCACGNQEFPSKRKLVEHMIDEHNSPFCAGDEKLIQYSVEYAKKTQNQPALFALREADIEVI